MWQQRPPTADICFEGLPRREPVRATPREGGGAFKAEFPKTLKNCQHSNCTHWADAHWMAVCQTHKDRCAVQPAARRTPAVWHEAGHMPQVNDGVRSRPLAIGQ